MTRKTTSVRLPEALIAALDRKAMARGATRSGLIRQALARAIQEEKEGEEDDRSWSPAFLSAIGTPHPELVAISAAMMSAIHAARARGRGRWPR